MANLNFNVNGANLDIFMIKFKMFVLKRISFNKFALEVVNNVLIQLDRLFVQENVK